MSEKKETKTLTTAEEVLQAMTMLENPAQRKVLMGFFKTRKGEYGAGDDFLGLKVPETRAIVRASRNLPLQEVEQLLDSRWHEVRLCGFLILVSKFERGEDADRLANFYLLNAERANNWDLVDMSSYKILGKWLTMESQVPAEEKRAKMTALAASDNMWKRRISMVSTLGPMHEGDASWCQEMADYHIRMFAQKPEWSHDLMHKAVGWMLREMGKRCGMDLLREFLARHVKQMPRTALRYAIERMDESERQEWLKK